MVKQEVSEQKKKKKNLFLGKDPILHQHGGEGEGLFVSLSIFSLPLEHLNCLILK